MKEIPLTQGKVALVDNKDHDWLLGFKWHLHKVENCFYAETYCVATRKNVMMHRLILGFPIHKIDHRDGNGLNNQRFNLRPANNFQNQQNRRINRSSKSGFKGVFWCNLSRRWVATIYINGRRKYLGWFEDREIAAFAYNEAAKKNFGEFARLNTL